MGGYRTERGGNNSSTDDGKGKGSGIEHGNFGHASQTVRAGQRCRNGGTGKRRTAEFGERECTGEEEDGTEDETHPTMRGCKKRKMWVSKGGFARSYSAARKDWTVLTETRELTPNVPHWVLIGEPFIRGVLQ